MKPPHIVKFSGGRSSGMMLMQLLKQRKLNAKRGDVIIFNNTSAEHSETYEFTRKMKILAEREYNIPFFWIEFQSYETVAAGGRWFRKPTYRLVNENPRSKKNPNGYRYKGEVFEEMVSLKGFLPSIFDRTCTVLMKIFPTNAFLSDWFVQGEGISRQGHNYSTPRIKNADIIAIHKKHNGAVPDKILLDKKAFVRKCAFIRPEQKWQDFSTAKLCANNKTVRDSIVGNKAQLHGEWAVDYVSCLGIRKDEERRIHKIKNRIAEAESKGGVSLSDQAWGEQILAPLVDKGITQQGVIKFWNKQKFNLGLPDSGLYSNCVFCPLKGKARLLTLAQNETESDKNNPESIKWWQKIERKYSRDLVAENRKITSEKDIRFVGFHGSTKELVYKTIEKNASLKNRKIDLEPDFMSYNFAPCNCTD